MSRRIAIVTGASSGLGREFVKLLAARDGISEIWAVARSKDKLQALAGEFGPKVRTFSIDLSVPANIEAFAAEQLPGADVSIAYLVNSAGYAKLCSYGDISIGQSVNMVDLNVNGVVAMCLACLPHMDRGARILNIASQASFQPLPYMNIYSATKAFVRSYSRALNVELRERGITVTAVCPGWMDTPFFDRGVIGAAKAPTRFLGMTTPDRVAAKALRDADRGRDISVCSLYVKFCHLAAKLLPQRAMMRFWLWQQRQT